MKKANIPIIVEIVGVALVSFGIAFFSLPVAMIALGTFLVWITEKNS
jgi:hypothetical protein